MSRQVDTLSADSAGAGGGEQWTLVQSCVDRLFPGTERRDAGVVGGGGPAMKLAHLPSITRLAISFTIAAGDRPNVPGALELNWNATASFCAGKYRASVW